MTWYEFVLALLVAIFGSNGLWSVLLNKREKKSKKNKLLMGLAYSEIINRSERYLDRGEISTDEYHELYHYLYKPYKDMGGNGTAAKLMEQVKMLPLPKPGTEGE